MRSLAAQNGAKRAQNLRKKPGQEMAWFTTPEIDEDRGAVAKQTHQVRTCNSQPPTTSLTSLCLLYPHAGTTPSCSGSSCQEGGEVQSACAFIRCDPQGHMRGALLPAACVKGTCAALCVPSK